MVRRTFVAALALIVAQSADAQDFAAAPTIVGNWTYAATVDGSEAIFATPAGAPQTWVRCVRATRRVSIAKPATTAVGLLNIWSSSAVRSVPASFDPASGRMTVQIGAFDPLLDALANSRGRIAFSVAGQPALVVPTWAELARVIEDCRG